MIIISFFLLLIIQLTLSDVYVYDDTNNLLAHFDDQGPNFGPSFPSDGLKGYITTTNPENGCTKMSSPPNISTYGYRWIALIPRTNGDDSCQFESKVRNAENANFSAVIIYNYDDMLLTMGATGKDVNIPSTLITHTNGLLLLSRYLYNKTSVNSTPIYHVKITPEEPFKFGVYVISFVVVVSVAFLVLIGFIIVKWHLQRRRTRRHRLPRSALKQLKIKKFIKGDPWEVCAICLDDYEDGAKLRILPCDHAYHMKCIDPWLLNNRRQCPVCKRYVFPNRDNSDEEENHDHQQARTPTEQTPLMHSNENNLVTGIPNNRQISERRLVNPLGSGIPNISYASNESSDNDEDISSSPRPTISSTVTTTEIIFNRPSSNSRQYGSVNKSSTASHAANFFVGSLGGTTDNTNTSIRSVVEDVSDIESTDDEHEHMHSVIASSEENRAYVNDEQSTIDSVQTRL